MQLLLGLFFFSILVTTGHSLQCIRCLAINTHCPDVKEDCEEDFVCMIAKLKSKDGKNNVIKTGCLLERPCKEGKDTIGQEFPAGYIEGVPFATVVESFVCNTGSLTDTPIETVVQSVNDNISKVNSKAPPFFASFFSAFLGLLLMKLLL